MADHPAQALRGVTANGVPFVALPPDGEQEARGMIILWHGADPPRTEEALAGALPLRDVAAWRVYLGLPLCGQRTPAGGDAEIMRREGKDAITLFFHPVIAGAVSELPEAVADLRLRLRVAPDLPLGIFGFSMGGAAALIAVSRRDVPIRAAVTWGAPIDMRELVDFVATHFHDITYEWTPERRALAAEISAVEHGNSLANSGAAILLGLGAADPLPLQTPTDAFAAALKASGATVESEVLPGVAHGFVDEPGIEAVPQGPQAQLVDQMVSRWFNRHLV